MVIIILKKITVKNTQKESFLKDNMFKKKQKTKDTYIYIIINKGVFVYNYKHIFICSTQKLDKEKD